MWKADAKQSIKQQWSNINQIVFEIVSIRKHFNYSFSVSISILLMKSS